MITAAQAARLHTLIEAVSDAKSDYDWQSEYGSRKGVAEAGEELGNARADLDNFIKGITE